MFYDLDYNVTNFNAIEINKFNITWLRQHMDLMYQEPILFNETIAYENVGNAHM